MDIQKINLLVSKISQYEIMISFMYTAIASDYKTVLTTSTLTTSATETVDEHTNSVIIIIQW